MGAGYRLGLSFLMDGWNASEARWADFLRFLATEVGAATLRNHDQLDVRDLDGVSHRVFVFAQGAVRVIAPSADEYITLEKAGMRRGAWLDGDFVVYLEELLAADVVVPVLGTAKTLDASSFADVLRLEGSTELRVRDIEWLTGVARRIILSAEVMDRECPGEADELREFGRSLLDDLAFARAHDFAIGIGAE